jgi:hypothetical protein
MWLYNDHSLTLTFDLEVKYFTVSPQKRWVPQTKKLQIIVSYGKNSLILTSFTFFFFSNLKFSAHHKLVISFAFLDRLMIFGMWLYNDETMSQYHHDHRLTLTLRSNILWLYVHLHTKYHLSIIKDKKVMTRDTITLKNINYLT